MKESLIKNKILKEICLDQDKPNILNNEFHLVYKLLKLTKNQFNLNFSNNIYLKSDDIILKLNYLKCFIDEIDHLFFNFHHFDLIIIFQKIKISNKIESYLFPLKKKFKEN
jgi:hypothetical protein